jgi:ATP-dependent Clp protease ATP-binding subunit ClpA
MLQPNKDLEQIFESAVNLAGEHHHEYITLEHFLHSLCTNDSFAKILTNFGADVKTLTEDVKKFIEEELKDLINPQVDRPKKTHTVDKVLNRAFTHVLFSGRQVIEPIDCFISMFAEKKSYATHFIKKANIDKDKFLNFIQHETPKEEEEHSMEIERLRECERE